MTMTSAHFIFHWFRHDDIPDWCVVVIVSGRPVDVIATGNTEAELLVNLDRESMRQRVPRSHFEIMDMRTSNTLHRGAAALLRATQARLDADRPAFLVYEDGCWWRPVQRGCYTTYEPWFDDY